MNEPQYRWYFTAAATRQYLAIAGLGDDDGGPNWSRAEREIGAHATVAREVPNATGISGTIYRTGRVRVGDKPKAIRLEFTVRHDVRHEGNLPQLVRVRAKG